MTEPPPRPPAGRRALVAAVMAPIPVGRQRRPEEVAELAAR
jgi:hypothetical protein